MGVNEDLIQAIKDGNLTNVTTALDGGADPDFRDDTDDKTALMVSAVTGGGVQAAITAILYNYGASPNLTEENYSRTALIWSALSYDRAALIASHADNGANLNYFDDTSKSALIHAIEQGFNLSIQTLCDKGVNIEAADPLHSFTPLLWASYYDNGGAITILCDEGADKTYTAEVRWIDQDNLPSGLEWDALWIAVYQENLNAIDKLIDCDFNPNAIDPESIISETVLMFAANKNKPDSVEKLIEKGAKISGRDDIGRTSLMIAVESDNIDVVTPMLAGDDPPVDLKDANNKTSLMIASEKGNTDIITALLNKSASISTKDIAGKTALMYAAAEGRLSAVEVLLNAGASINARDLSDNTALLHAASSFSRGFKDVVEYLINQNANINASNNQYWTALMWAAKKGYTDTVNLLISKDVNVDAQDINGRSALAYAREWAQDAVATILEAASSPVPVILIMQETTALVNGEGLYFFGEVTKDTESDYIIFTIYNNGIEDLEIYDINIKKGIQKRNPETGELYYEYEETEDFVLDATDTSSIIADGEITTFKVKFTPKEAQSATAVVSIVSNDPATGTYLFQVTGLGV